MKIISGAFLLQYIFIIQLLFKIDESPFWSLPPPPGAYFLFNSYSRFMKLICWAEMIPNRVSHHRKPEAGTRRKPFDKMLPYSPVCRPRTPRTPRTPPRLRTHGTKCAPSRTPDLAQGPKVRPKGPVSTAVSSPGGNAVTGHARANPCSNI